MSAEPLLSSMHSPDLDAVVRMPAKRLAGEQQEAAHRRAIQRRGEADPPDADRLKLGDAFDVTASKKQTDFQRRPPASPHNYAYESAYEIVLKNAKKEAVTVTVREPVPGDWRMMVSSHRHAKVASGTAQWQVTIPAEGDTLGSEPSEEVVMEPMPVIPGSGLPALERA